MIEHKIRTREEIQDEGKKAIIENDYKGTVLMAPRTGKTKTVIESLRGKGEWKIIVSSPEVSIKDNWTAEMEKWNLDFRFPSICHRSLNKIDEELDLLIIDEVQTLSVAQILAIQQKKPKRLLFVSGTVSWGARKVIGYHLGYNVIFDYSIGEAVKDGIISDFEIIVVNCSLNNTDKNILTGRPDNRFYTTERDLYLHLTKKVDKFAAAAAIDGKYQITYNFYIRERANFLYTAASKLNAARELIWSLEDRVLIFSTRIEVANKLSPFAFHSKSDQENLDKFKKGEIKKLAVAKMLSMGITIPDLKVAVIHQLQKNSDISLQKILRTCNVEEDKTKKAKIWIFQYPGTKDEDWVKDALQEVPQSKIRYVDWVKLKKTIL